MTSSEAASYAYNKLKEHGLGSWSVRISKAPNHNWFLGLCSYKDKCIIINGHHVDMHPDAEIRNTILHEVAHALTPDAQHNDTWSSKAREIGCDNTLPCSHLSLSYNIIDAIRSGANIEVEVEEQIIRTVKHKVTRLQDKCESCGAVAEEIRSSVVEGELEDNKFIFLKCGHLLIKKIPKSTPFHKLISIDGRKPYPFQVKGMEFLERALAIGKGGAIFDEMGLGKTVQALGYIHFHKTDVTPVLFVVKSAIKFQWLKELYRWTGEIAQIIERSSDIVLPMFNYYIISYDLLVPKVKKSKKTDKISVQGFDLAKLHARGFQLIVMDECQQIKNPDSSRTQQVRQLVKETKVIALSGTPWKNRGSEFFSVLNMLDPLKFHSYAAYLRRWVTYYAQGNQWKEGGISDIPAFKEYIKELAIRREVDIVMPEMPSVNRTMFNCNLDDFNQKQYNDEVSDFVKKMNQRAIDGEDEKTDMSLVADLQRMRHITGLSKIPVTVEWAREFYEETDRKLVIFVHHIDVGQILYQELKDAFPSLKVLQITGDMSSEEKFNAQESFNQPERCFMVASTLAAGEGLNLQTCSDSIMHERQWNPANEDQAAPGRFRRIGQTKMVNVIFVTANGTIDEFIGNMVEEKRAQFHNSMNEGQAIEWNQGSLIKELVNMIVSNHNKQNKNKKAS